MKFRTPNGTTVEIISLAMTGNPTSPHPRSPHTSDGLWMVIKYPNGLERGQVKVPATLMLPVVSPEIHAFMSAELATYGIDLADLEGGLSAEHTQAPASS
jgi:hypothetical protein